METKVLVVLGAGPGVGSAVARRFGEDGYDVALVARSPERLAALGSELQEAGVTAGWTAVDLADTEELRAAVTRFGGHLGRIDTLHFNPSVYRAADPLHLDPDELLADLRLGTAALLTAVQAARPFMRTGGRVVVTGSMAADHPSHHACSLGVQKAALRNLVQSLDATLAPDGIRAATLTVNGVLAEGTAFAPERVAAALHALAARPDAEWTVEVPYDG